MRCILALGMMVSALHAAGTQAVVSRPVADMFSKPSQDADVVSQAIYSTAVALIEQRPGWARVRTPDDYTGWMQSSAFRVLKAGEAAYAPEGRAVAVESLFANIYREPDVTKHAPLLTVPFETRLEPAGEPKDNGERWLAVRLVNGRTAWVQRGDVSFEAMRLQVASLPEFARRFLGLPYYWGGTSTYGFDCSGFIQMLMRRTGVLIPRDAQPQAAWSGFVPVERTELRPGDLVYFGASAKRITHTGMYMGDGKFVSATVHTQPMVRIDQLDDPYWGRLYVCARRLK